MIPLYSARFFLAATLALSPTLRPSCALGRPIDERPNATRRLAHTPQIELAPEVRDRMEMPCSVMEQIGERATQGGVLWPNGRVPYRFDANVTPADESAMLAAMAEIEAIAAVDFVQRANETAFIHIQDSPGNSAPVGWANSQRTVNIFNWNIRFIMVHELLHILGFRHEQSRPDRDGFVQIFLTNVCQTCCGGGSCNHNFNLQPGSNPYGPYDFDSVMHYGLFDFSANGQQTMNVLTPPQGPTHQARTFIGQREYMSRFDRYGVMFHYPQAHWRFVDIANSQNGNGTFANPWNNVGTVQSQAPAGSVIWIEPGHYGFVGTFSSPMTLEAPQGGVTIGQ